MNAPLLDDPRSRLNYFNGQRLAASDLRTEQGHHLGMRRVLNRSLYSPGVVTGLQVEPDRADPTNPADKSWRHRVVVRRGLAFDHLGREIFLPQDMSVQVMGAPSTTPGEVFGNLLTIAYREQRQHPSSERCSVGAACRPCGSSLAWGAPTRIMADAVFEFLDAWPTDDSGRVVLGQVELNKSCEVVQVLQGVRRYAQPVKPQTVRAISLEGEKDVALGNAKLLHFHVTGGFPESASLYLRARLFNTLYYTELGQHLHHLQFNTALAGQLPTHRHPIDLSNIALSEMSDHRHEIWAGSDDGEAGSIDFGDGDDPNAYLATGPGGERGGRANMEVKPAGKHSHSVLAGSVPTETDWAGGADAHRHAINNDTQNTGLLPAARTGAPLTYLNNLRVLLDGQDVTTLICTQLSSRPGQAGQWTQLGDGSANHALAHADGTGEINLLQLGVELGLGPHTLEFRVLQANVGGNLQYNLYLS
jgi:hypothetical protein